MQKLPIGIQTFENIRLNNYLYVDKTKQILNLINHGECYFLSRPRRFGKSLTLSTIEAMFKGQSELFKGLYAEEWVKEQSKNPNPVIKLDIGALSGYKNSDELNEYLIENINAFLYVNDLNIPLKKSADVLLFNVIVELYKQFGKVVVLIDEYDKPITDNISNLKKAEEMREILRSFYLVLKSSSQYLKFVMITGVSKFSKVGVFSGLNNLNDISMGEDYSDIVGYTQQELEDNFGDWIEKVSQKLSMSREELLKNVKLYYDGFSFDGITRLYNPFSVLNFFSKGDFRNYWYNSAMPSFLVKYLKSHKIKEPKEYIQKKVFEDFVNSREIENATVESFLYQAGYLTIAEKKGSLITLDYPNEEVRSSMDQLFLENFYNVEGPAFSDNIWMALENNDLKEAVNIFNEVLKGIPYDDYPNRDEAWYRTLFVMLLRVIGITYFAEVHNYKGRSDVVILLKNKVIILEFKFAKNSRQVSKMRKLGEEQIKNRDYASPYKNTGKEIITAVIIANDDKRQVTL